MRLVTAALTPALEQWLPGFLLPGPPGAALQGLLTVLEGHLCQPGQECPVPAGLRRHLAAAGSGPALPVSATPTSFSASRGEKSPDGGIVNMFCSHVGWSLSASKSARWFWQLDTSALGVQLLLTAACEGRGCLGDPTGRRGQSACGHSLCGRVQHREVQQVP